MDAAIRQCISGMLNKGGTPDEIADVFEFAAVHVRLGLPIGSLLKSTILNLIEEAEPNGDRAVERRKYEICCALAAARGEPEPTMAEFRDREKLNLYNRASEEHYRRKWQREKEERARMAPPDGANNPPAPPDGAIAR
jgi:hypothetical protein